MKIIQEIEQHYNIKLELIDKVEQWGRTRSYCAKGDKILSLNLRECGVKDFPFLSELPHLQKLDLSRNALSSLVFEKAMADLNLLDISYNKADLQVSFNAKFPKLQYLYIYGSNLQQIEIQYPMPVLNTLHLAKNELQAFDLPNIRQFTEMETLYLKENNISNLQSLPEDHENSWEAVRNFLLAKAVDDKPYYNEEVKLVFLGNTGVGKSTLAKQLVTGKFDPNIKSTHGIDVNKIWEIKQEKFAHIAQFENLEKIRLNIWDFGGQEYYHATHRLFLTTDSLYLILWITDTDKQFTRPNEKEIDVEYFPRSYWKQSIHHYTENTATIIEVQNQVKEGEQKTYPHLVDCKQGGERSIKKHERNLEDLEEKIIEELRTIQSLGAEYPGAYEQIRSGLQKNAKKKPMMTFDEFKKFCQMEAFTNDMDEEEIKRLEEYLQNVDIEKLSESDQKALPLLWRYVIVMQDDSQVVTLAELLDKIGSLVCFRSRGIIKSDNLKKYVFINPQWLTGAIYKILEKGKVKFDKVHIKETVGKEKGFEDLEEEDWIELMKQFELVFGIEEDGKMSCIAPQYLPTKCQDKKALGMTLGAKKGKMCTAFALKYPDFLPKSNFLRFIVQYGPQSTKYDDERDYLIWKEGMVFTCDSSRKTVFAECNYDEGIISFQIEENDNDYPLAKEIFDTLYEIDNCSGIQVSVKKEENWIEWVEVAKLLKKQEEPEASQIEGTKGETLNICDFAFLLPERVFGDIGKKEKLMKEPVNIPKDIPIQLENAIKDDKLILFVGSGMSIKFGFPNWKNLAIEICEEVKETSPIEALRTGFLSPIEVISKLEKKYKKEIVEKLEKTYAKIPKDADLNLHKKLFNLSRSVITTNYDKAFETAKEDLYVIPHFDAYKLSKIKDKLNAKEPFVYKLHGCINSPDNCILFQSNYDKLYKTPDQNFSVFELQKMFSDYTFLFLGYSMNDTEINDLFGAVNDMQKGYASNHYIILTSSFDDYEKLENYPKKLESYKDIEKVIDGLIAFKNSL